MSGIAWTTARHLLGISLVLLWPHLVSAQPPDAVPLPVPPDSTLRATADGQAAEARVAESFTSTSTVKLVILPGRQDVFPLGERVTAHVTIASGDGLSETTPTPKWLRLYRDSGEPAAGSGLFLWQTRVPEEILAPGGADVSAAVPGTHDVPVELPDRVGYWWIRVYSESDRGTLLAETRLQTVAHAISPHALSVDPRECSAGEKVSVRLELPEAKHFGEANRDGVIVALLKHVKPHFMREQIVEYVQIPYDRIAGAHEVTYTCPSTAGLHDIAVFDRFVEPRYLLAAQSLLVESSGAAHDPTGDGFTISCADVTAVRDAVQKLDDAVGKATIGYDALPTSPMYQLPPSGDRLSAQIEKPRQNRVAEIIKNRGADDFLVRQRDDDSVVGGFKILVKGIAEPGAPCDREQWKIALRDLRRAQAEFKRKVRGVELLVEGAQAEAAYQRRWMAPIFSRPRIDSAPLPVLLEWLGVPHAHEVAVKTTLGHVLYDAGPYVGWRWLNQPFHMGMAHFALGALSAIDSTITVTLATWDLLELRDARRSMPPFLQALEQSAYLEPLLANYRAVSDAMDDVVVQVSRMGKGPP